MPGNAKNRKSMSADRQRITPLLTLVGKQKIGKEDADAVALPLLAHFDAAKRGLGPAVGQQHLYKHLLTAQILGARLQNRMLYEASVAGCDALMKASQRPTKLLDLSTSEYHAIRKCFGLYLRILPMLECSALDRAGKEADRLMGSMDNDAGSDNGSAN